MTQKRSFWLVAIMLIGMLALAACGSSTDDAGTASDSGDTADDTASDADDSAEEFVFGLILVGPRNDRGWSQAHAEGGEYLEENLDGARMILFESLNPADKPEATLEGVVDEMVDQGAQMIITTSDEFEEDTVGAAEKYPDVVFINVSGDDAWADGQDAGQAPDNLGNIMGRMEEMQAIAGCAAALTTETGSIGYLGPLINFETRRLAASSYLGAAHCYETYAGGDAADLSFTVTWIGFWFNIPGVTLDPTEVVNQFFDSGSDVIISGIDTSEAIVVGGQRAAAGEAVSVVPYDFEGACDEAPEICLGIPFFNWGPAYLNIAHDVQAGTWEQSWEWVGPNWDALADLDSTNVGWFSGEGLSDENAADLDAFIASLADGSFNLWAGPINLQDGSEYIADGAVATDFEVWYLPGLVEGMVGPSE